MEKSFTWSKEDGEIKAACLLLQKRVLKKFSLFYSPRGYLIDYNNYELLEFFTKEIKKYVESKNILFNIDTKDKLDKAKVRNILNKFI